MESLKREYEILISQHHASSKNEEVDSTASTTNLADRLIDLNDRMFQMDIVGYVSEGLCDSLWKSVIYPTILRLRKGKQRKREKVKVEEEQDPSSDDENSDNGRGGGAAGLRLRRRDILKKGPTLKKADHDESPTKPKSTALDDHVFEAAIGLFTRFLLTVNHRILGSSEATLIKSLHNDTEAIMEFNHSLLIRLGDLYRYKFEIMRDSERITADSRTRTKSLLEIAGTFYANALSYFPQSGKPCPSFSLCLAHLAKLNLTNDNISEPKRTTYGTFASRGMGDLLSPTSTRGIVHSTSRSRLDNINSFEKSLFLQSVYQIALAIGTLEPVFGASSSTANGAKGIRFFSDYSSQFFGDDLLDSAPIAKTLFTILKQGIESGWDLPRELFANLERCSDQDIDWELVFIILAVVFEESKKQMNTASTSILAVIIGIGKKVLLSSADKRSSRSIAFLSTFLIWLHYQWPFIDNLFVNECELRLLFIDILKLLIELYSQNLDCTITAASTSTAGSTVYSLSCPSDCRVIGLITFSPFRNHVLSAQLHNNVPTVRSSFNPTLDSFSSSNTALSSSLKDFILLIQRSMKKFSHDPAALFADRVFCFLYQVSMDQNIEYLSCASKTSAANHNYYQFKLEDPKEKKIQMEALMKKLARERLKDHVESLEAKAKQINEMDGKTVYILGTDILLDHLSFVKRYCGQNLGRLFIPVSVLHQLDMEKNGKSTAGNGSTSSQVSEARECIRFLEARITQNDPFIEFEGRSESDDNTNNSTVEERDLKQYLKNPNNLNEWKTLWKYVNKIDQAFLASCFRFCRVNGSKSSSIIVTSNTTILSVAERMELTCIDFNEWKRKRK